eukprot:2647405-Pyramimonas_sp.AAC.1
MRDPDPDKTRAVRKAVRVIIENAGKDPKEVNKLIDAQYRRGVARDRDTRVAEWGDAGKHPHGGGAG